jgi:Rieske Fe-S protein
MTVATIGRPGTGTAAVASEFRQLRNVIEIPLAAIEQPGSQVLFKAWIDEPAAASGELLLRGILLRLQSGSLDAFSLICPHEICEIESVTDSSLLPRDLGPLPTHPLLACPCHFSVFDPEDGGTKLAGPAPRGLYRFGLRVVADHVLIDRVEASTVERFSVDLQEV